MTKSLLQDLSFKCVEMQTEQLLQPSLATSQAGQSKNLVATQKPEYRLLSRVKNEARNDQRD